MGILRGVLAIVLSGLLAVVSPQEPSAELQRALTLDSSTTRYRAAVRLAAMGGDGQAWLLKQVGKGSPERQRSLLLACALLGSEPALAEVEKVARRGSRRRADPQRAYALLLYGAYHPAAGEKPKEDWARCQSDFERACLLAGLLAHPARLVSRQWDAQLADSGAAELATLLAMGRLLAGEEVALSADVDARFAAAALLASVRPEAAARPAAFVEAQRGRVPALWVAAARRDPSRGAEQLRRLPAAGEGAAAGLILREVEPSARQEVFQHFHARLIEPQARAWLWGTAGELGLELPPPLDAERLDSAEVAGILELARTQSASAASAAAARLGAARARLDEGGLAEETWPAALTLALVLADAEDRDAEDLQRLQSHLEQASAVDKVRLWPVWNLARGALAEAAVRDHWLAVWSRDLGAGAIGFLDVEGPRWLAYLLVGGTQAAEERLQLLEAYPALELASRDYSRDHNLYRDIADFLSWGFRLAVD